MKVSDVIASFMIEHGISTVFGIIGSANSHLYDSFIKYGIQILNVHNEQAAVIAASSYFRTCGKLAVALVTAGGGATNSVTGIVSAWADSIPVFILCGQESSFYVKEYNDRRMYGTQGIDVVHMVSKCTKYAKTIMDATSIQEELEKAHSITLDDRKGPVLLDIPFNIQSCQIDKREWNFSVPLVRTISNETITEVSNLLKNVKRPIILCGHGVKLSGGVDDFHSLIEQLRIPVLVTWSAIDIMSHKHPLFFGSPGVYGKRASNFIFQKSDFILVLGSRLALPQTGYDMEEIARSAKIVMVDIDPTENKSFIHKFIHADCKEFCHKLALECEFPEWINECECIRKQFPVIEDAHADDEFPNSYRIIDSISNFLTQDHIIVTDMGTALLSGHQAIRLDRGMKMFSSYGLGEMGYGLPAAFGAAIASPTKEVLCLNCDGGMMMNLQELQTIIQHKLNVKIVIFNNDGYLMIKHTQKMLFNGNYIAVNKTSGVVLPDYIKLAKAFGYTNYRIKCWEDFNFYFPKFINTKGPAICEIFMPPEQDFLPKVKGVLQKNGSIFAPPLEEMSPLLSIDVIKSVMKDDTSMKSLLIQRPQHE